MVNIIKPDTGNLFIIKYPVDGLAWREWRLAQIELTNTLKLNPQALVNARLLVIFYVAHPDDENYSASNQCFWKEYHRDDGQYDLSQKFNLAKPALNKTVYYQHNLLKPYRDWVNLHDEDTLLVDTFKFAFFDGK